MTNLKIAICLLVFLCVGAHADEHQKTMSCMEWAKLDKADPAICGDSKTIRVSTEHFNKLQVKKCKLQARARHNDCPKGALLWSDGSKCGDAILACNPKSTVKVDGDAVRIWD